MVVIVQTLYFEFLIELSVLGYPQLEKVYFEIVCNQVYRRTLNIFKSKFSLNMLEPTFSDYLIMGVRIYIKKLL